MSDTHEHLWTRLARHRPRHGLRYSTVHLGFWSTLVFMALMGVDVLVPPIFQGWYIWIAVAYLICQLLEFVGRDPLDWSEITEWNLFAIIPALGGLLLKVINASMASPLLTPFGLQVLNLWLVMAWICFVFGLLFAMRALAAPYRRDETERRGPTT